MKYCKFGVLMRGQAGERVGGDEMGVVRSLTQKCVTHPRFCAPELLPPLKRTIIQNANVK